MSSFKENDFVRYIHSNTSKPLKINNINCGRYYFEGTNMSCLEYEIRPWTPEPGDFVIINFDIYDDKFIVKKVKKFNQETKLVYFYDFTSYKLEDVRPFNGELPSNLKDL